MSDATTLEPKFMKLQPSLSIAIILIVSVLLVSSSIVGVLLPLLMPGVEPTLQGFLAYSVTAVITIGFTVSIKGAFQIYVPSLKPEIRKINPRIVVTGFLMIVAMSIVVTPIVEIIPDIGMDMLDKHMNSGFWAMTTAVIVAPVFEEYICRGVIQTNLVNQIGAIKGIIIASAIFGAIHIIPQQAFGAMMTALVIGSTYYLTGSIITVIVLHFLNNGLASLMHLIYGTTDQIEILLTSNPTIHKIVYGVSLIMLTLGAIYVVRWSRSRKIAVLYDNSKRND